ncbi:MAG: hypothetical protein KA369_07990 [Spirochaetes bacterium]|nr:hypothetical protein [Spirochaetota bacterium]
MTLEEAVKQNKKIKILAYSVSDYVESRMKEVLGLIFDNFEKPELVPPVYTCLKELVINAVKANFKNIYFEGYASKNRSESVIDYEMALKLFKLELSRENAGSLERLARDYDMRAEVVIQSVENCLNITVSNPVEMTDREKTTVQNKLQSASRYSDITEYFAENDEEVSTEIDEGAGLGLILISMMLRSMGGNDRDFVITSENHKTTAFLRIPVR